MKLVLRGPGEFKSTSDPKTVCYSPRKRPEIAEFTSCFYDFMKLVLQGPEQFKSTPDPKTVCYSRRKRPEMTEILGFLRFYESRVTGSWTV